MIHIFLLISWLVSRLERHGKFEGAFVKGKDRTKRLMQYNDVVKCSVYTSALGGIVIRTDDLSPVSEIRNTAMS